MDRTEWLKERKKGIGGSDVHHALNIKPYGCARYLWYDKRDMKPDYEQIQTDIMSRGHELEDKVAELYTRKTGRKVWKQIDARVHRSLQFARVNLDRIIVGDKRGTGVLEAKTAGREMFFKFQKEGLTPGYILQMQHAFMVTGYTWGSFAILWADGWQFIHFDIERDEKMIDTLVRGEERFWKMVTEGGIPDRLTPKDRRCQKCNFRTTCQGELLTRDIEDIGEEIPVIEELEQHMADWIRFEEIEKEAEEMKELSKNYVRNLLGKLPVAQCRGSRVHYKPMTSIRVNPAALKKNYPKVYKKVTYTIKSRPLKKFAI